MLLQRAPRGGGGGGVLLVFELDDGLALQELGGGPLEVQLVLGTAGGHSVEVALRIQLLQPLAPELRAPAPRLAPRQSAPSSAMFCSEQGSFRASFRLVPRRSATFRDVRDVLR